ncbi:DUF4386 domain-containing protein [Aquimarina rhabdastrellae]
MYQGQLKIRYAGLLFIAAMIAGILSVAPSIDSTKYLTEAAANSNNVIVDAFFQFMMSLAYLGVAILLYPILKKFDGSLAIGFLSFRIIAATLVIFGTILLLSILALSHEFVYNSPQSALDLKALGNVLKIKRDYINHVFMVLVLCIGNLMLYVLLIKSNLVPIWLSIWGLLGTLFSGIASILILFQSIDIITPEYIILNIPTAILELVLGIWLILYGFNSSKTNVS